MMPHPAFFALQMAAVMCDASEITWSHELAYENWADFNGVKDDQPHG